MICIQFILLFLVGHENDSSHNSSKPDTSVFDFEQRRLADEREKKRKLNEIKSHTQRAAKSPKNLANAMPVGGSQDTTTSLQSAVSHFKRKMYLPCLLRSLPMAAKTPPNLPPSFHLRT